MFTDVIILAGGIGERLWPLSSKEHPKQFIETGRGTFFQTALKRAVLLKPSRSIIVVTRREFKAVTAAQCLEARKFLSAQQAELLQKLLVILLEPEPRHTAAAVLYALSYLSLSHNGGEALVLTSDHIIDTDAQFISSCKKAYACVKENYFVCFAVKPLFPSTGFGYIEAGAAAGEGVYDIVSFKEKPGEQTAADFLTQGNYWWNSGMFAFQKSFYEEGIREFVPALSASFARLAAEKPRAYMFKGFRVVQKWDALDKAYKNAASLSIDNAIAEKTKRARCVVAEFSWDDIGSWDVFASRVPCTKENAVFVESTNCSVYADIPVALCGVSDVIVAVKDGKVLVMRKGKSSLIREAARKTEELSAKKAKR